MTSIRCDNCCQNELNGLRYKGFSLVFIQTFVLPDNFSFSERKALKTGLFEKIENDIDSQIFMLPPDSGYIRRYRLHGFKMDVNLDDPYAVALSGHIYVEMSLFFNKTVSLSYRLVNDGKAFKSDNLLTTDHLISLASLNMGAEHWSKNDDEDDTNINLKLKNVIVSQLEIAEDATPILQDGAGSLSLDTIDLEGAGNSFEVVCERYKDMLFCNCLEQTQRNRLKTIKMVPCIMRDLNYVMVDVWEDVQHHDGTFQEFDVDEAGIINHIHDYHKQELVGLMSLYPGEWPFRTKESYDDVCGCNIAIDTDDLVLVNQNMCVVLGTYGLRSAEAPTDWAEHLAERSHYHVSWPEYLLILEMILAKKYTIAYVNDKLLDSTLVGDNKVDPQELIANNSRLNVEMTRILLQLDAVKYSKFVSHKIMFDRTVKRLELNEDMVRLNSVIDTVNNSLHNLSEYKSMRQSNTLNLVLGLISAVSLMEILFQPIELPFIGATLSEDSSGAALNLIWFAALLMVSALVISVVIMLKDFILGIFRKKNKK